MVAQIKGATGGLCTAHWIGPVLARCLIRVMGGYGSLQCYSSGFGPQADIIRDMRHVRKVPEPEVSTNMNPNRAGKVHAFGVDDFPVAQDGRNPHQDRGASQAVP